MCLGCITISFNIAAIAAVVPVIGPELGVSDFEASKIIPYYLMPYGIGALIYAPLTRFLTYRVVMAGTMMLFAITCYVCGSAQTLASILIARVLMGVTAASAIPLGLMIIGELFEKRIRGRLVGGFFSSAFIASLAGIALSGIANWRWLFYVPSGMGVILAAGFLLFGRDHLGRVHVGHVNYLATLRNTKIRRIFLFIFTISLLYHGVHKWYGIYLSRVYGFSQLQISGYFIIAAIGGMFGQLLGGVISDKRGRLMACRMGIAGLSMGTMLLAGWYPPVLLGAVMALVSMGWTVGHNGLSTTITDFPEKDRPMIASLNSSVRFISGSIGFTVSRYFVEKDFGITFFVIGILMLSMSFIVKRAVIEH